jgi:hypothetical protein
MKGETMKRFFFPLLAGLATCGTLLITASPAEAAKGKSGLGNLRASGGGSNSNFRPNLSSSPKMLSSSPGSFPKSTITRNVGTLNKNSLATRSLQKAPTSSFLSKTNKFSKGGTTLPQLGSTNRDFPTGSLNKALLKNQKLTGGFTNRGNFNKNLTNNKKLTDAVKTGSLGSIVNRGGFNSGNTGGFQGAINPADRGKLLDAIKNGSLKPVTNGTTTLPGFGNLPNRGDLVDRSKIIDAIKDGGLKPIGGGNNAPPEGGQDPGNNDAPPPADIEPPADVHHPPHCPENPHHCPPHKHCHPHFPWWPVVIDGGHYCGPVYCPPVQHVTLVEQPIALTVDAASQTALDAAVGVDLELFDVRIVDSGDPARKLGPRYRVVFRNLGTAPAANFQIMLMASQDGTPSTEAPMATAEVEALAPGETRSVDVRLPMNDGLAAMPTLIVAIDSAVQVAETDEQNNVAVLERAKIAMAEGTAMAALQSRGN